MRGFLIFIVAIVLSSSFYGCSRCSRSGSAQGNSVTKERSKRSKAQVKRNVNNASNVVHMSKRGGVYEIPATVNGVELDFIFDTGASDVTISSTEAMFLLKSGKLKEEDFLGTNQYQLANGSISEGTIINLRSVKIGNRSLENVQAAIIHNAEAPLLLGQSALENFGEFSINYKKNTITFK